MKEILEQLLKKVSPSYRVSLRNEMNLAQMRMDNNEKWRYFDSRLSQIEDMGVVLDQVANACKPMQQIEEGIKLLSRIEEECKSISRLDEIFGFLERIEEMYSSVNQIETTARLLDSLLSGLGINRSSNEDQKQVLNQGRQESDYIKMQRDQYEDVRIPPDDVVGQYQWHENFPYETFLLYKYGDIRYPILTDFQEKKALDFGCGPGRMVKRMQKYFLQVDGCDISARLLEEARRRVPESTFYLTNGNDLGYAFREAYDFIYCTISMQHIASHTIRTKILRAMYDALKPGGCITLQMGYNPDYPYVWLKSHVEINGTLVQSWETLPQADYLDDDYGASETNGMHDVGIGKKDLDIIKKDVGAIFRDVSFWFADVKDYFDDLKGAKHCSYWATAWIFINAYK